MGSSKRRVVVSIITQLMVLAALVAPTPHVALGQYCAPGLYMFVDGRLRGDYVELVITNIDGQAHGGYSASVWAEQVSNHQIVFTDTFTLPSMQPHSIYTRTYDAEPFIPAGEIAGYFQWNSGSCPPWMAMFYRCWMPASNYANDDDGLDDLWTEIIQPDDLGEGY